MRTLQFTVPAEYENRKALHFLRGSAGLSAHLVRVLKTLPDGILKNGEPVRTIDRIHEGDVLTLNLPDEAPTVEPAADFDGNLSVLYEDEDLLVINKPGNLAVHPTHNHQGDTLANIIAAYLLAEGRPAVFRAVGRLDKGTSGIVVCALNPYAAARLQGHVHKTYLAVPTGHYEGSGTIDVPIYRPDPGKTLRAAGPAGDHAVTHWTALRSGQDLSLVEVTLETGRTHQIRVHFQSLGTPLAGDDMYGAPAHPDICRQALHCARAQFVHPVTGSAVDLRAPLPQDMENVISNIDS